MGKDKVSKQDEAVAAVAWRAANRQRSQDVHAERHGCPHNTDGYNPNGCGWCDESQGGR